MSSIQSMPTLDQLLTTAALSPKPAHDVFCILGNSLLKMQSAFGPSIEKKEAKEVKSVVLIPRFMQSCENGVRKIAISHRDVRTDANDPYMIKIGPHEVPIVRFGQALGATVTVGPLDYNNKTTDDTVYTFSFRDDTAFAVQAPAVATAASATAVSSNHYGPAPAPRVN